MADHDSIEEFEYHTLSGVYEILANAAREHAPEAYQQAADTLDMTPAFLLRGLAYISHRLAMTPDDELAPKEMQRAQEVVGELTALCALLIEHQNDIACMRFSQERKQADSGSASMASTH